MRLPDPTAESLAEAWPVRMSFGPNPYKDTQGLELKPTCPVCGKPVYPSERPSWELAAEMHDLSVHLWNALDRERRDYMQSGLRNDVEGIQRSLSYLASLRPPR